MDHRSGSSEETYSTARTQHCQGIELTPLIEKCPARARSMCEGLGITVFSTQMTESTSTLLRVLRYTANEVRGSENISRRLTVT